MESMIHLKSNYKTSLSKTEKKFFFWVKIAKQNEIKIIKRINRLSRYRMLSVRERGDEYSLDKPLRCLR